MQVHTSNDPVLLAQATPLGGTGGNGLTFDRIVSWATELVSILLQLGEVAAVGFIVWYGLKMVMSRGDAVKFAAARKGLLLAFLGAVIIFGVYTIIATVQGTVESIGH